MYREKAEIDLCAGSRPRFLVTLPGQGTMSLPVQFGDRACTAPLLWTYHWDLVGSGEGVKVAKNRKRPYFSCLLRLLSAFWPFPPKPPMQFHTFVGVLIFWRCLNW